MNCSNCSGVITEFQLQEYDGCCCSYCENKISKIKTNCGNCGLPLDGDEYYESFCSGGCCGEWAERSE